MFLTMALDNVGKNDHVKLHFTTREGKYRQMHLAESFYGKNLQYPTAQVINFVSICFKKIIKIDEKNLKNNDFRKDHFDHDWRGIRHLIAHDMVVVREKYTFLHFFSNVFQNNH